jgi:hypothetical protein
MPLESCPSKALISDAEARKQNSLIYREEKDKLASYRERLGLALHSLPHYVGSSPGLYSGPHEPFSAETTEKVLSEFEALARAVLRLYSWDGPHGWSAVDLDTQIRRKIDATWVPASVREAPECRHLRETDEHIFIEDRKDLLIDLRPMVFDIIYNVHALRAFFKAGEALHAVGAAFQLTLALTELATVLEKEICCSKACITGEERARWVKRERATRAKLHCA